MLKRVFAFTGFVAFLVCFTVSSFADTFFLYADETYEGKPVAVHESAKEGVMEGIFESGNIIFDDIGNKTIEIPELLDQAFQYGADFLIILNVRSVKKEIEPGKGIISSEAEFFLYDVKRELVAGKGMYVTENSENGNLLSRSQFWFKLGLHVAGEIETLCGKYRS